jgi:trehalose utilization protein
MILTYNMSYVNFIKPVCIFPKRVEVKYIIKCYNINKNESGEATMKIRVTVWNEYRHEKQHENIAAIYPNGIHGALASYLGEENDIEVRTATLDEPEHGLTDEVLNNTDVLIWWGHCAHQEVSDEIAAKVHKRVLCGMGFIALHSAHYSKPFVKLMGTTCSLKWREVGEKERLWVIEPSHPIAEGLKEYIELEHEEMYGERFDIPEPDTLVFVSWFKGGEVFRSGCCYNRGYGKVFYFRPGHESFPTYHNADIIKVIKNAVRWARPIVKVDDITAPNVQPLEKLE